MKHAATYSTISSKSSEARSGQEHGLFRNVFCPETRSSCMGIGLRTRVRLSEPLTQKTTMVTVQQSAATRLLQLFIHTSYDSSMKGCGMLAGLRNTNGYSRRNRPHQSLFPLLDLGVTNQKIRARLADNTEHPLF